jgi:Mn-dependent DtxR family transcriptional regulator
MLGVHRPTISLAAESLRERGLITYHRGQIAVTDRAGLEAASCEHYQEFRRVYQELLGPIAALDGEPGTGLATNAPAR